MSRLHYLYSVVQHMCCHINFVEGKSTALQWCVLWGGPFVWNSCSTCAVCVLVSLLSHNRQYSILRSCKVGCVWQRPSCSTCTLCVNHYTNCVHSVTEVLLQAILVLHCVVYCKTGLCFELHHLPNFANCFALTQVTCWEDARRAASRSSSSSTFSHKHAT